MAHRDAEREPIKIPEPKIERALFAERIIGQEEAVDVFAHLFVKIRSGIRPLLSGPIDVKLLLGPSGVGKTEIVYRLAEILAETNPTDARSKVLRIDGGQYQSDHQIAKLLGSPPGYIGSRDPRYPDSGIDPLLSQANLDKHRLFYRDHQGKQKSLTVILVDEFEKAHNALEKAFLSILDKGELQLGDNRVTNFRDTVVFFTSNIGSWQVEKLQEEIARSDMSFPEDFKEAAGMALIKDDSRDIYKKAFQERFIPEFRGRVKDLIFFHQLSKEELIQIVAIKIKAMEQEFKAGGIDTNLNLLPTAASWLAGQGYDLSEGARALERVLDKFIRDPLIAVNSSIHKRTVEIGMDKSGLEPQFFLESSESQAVGYVTEAPSGTQAPGDIENKLLQKLKQGGLPHYQQCVEDYIKRGLLTAEDVKILPSIRRELRSQLMRLSQKEGQEALERFKNAIVYLGIGTREEVDDLLKGAN